MNTKKLIGTIIGVVMFAALIAGATFAWLTFGTSVGNDVLAGNTVNFVINYTAGSTVSELPILESDLAKPTAIGAELTTNNAAPLVVIIKKPRIDNDNDNINDQPDGHASIWLQTTTNTTLTKEGVVQWAICRDPDVETTGEQVDDVCGSITDFKTGYEDGIVLNMGTVTNSGPIPLLSDARLADNNQVKGDAVIANCSTDNDISMCTGSSKETYMLEEDGVSYFVYFWFEGEKIQNKHLDEQYNKTGTTEQYIIGQGGTPDRASGIKHSLYSGYVFASATQLYK